MRKKDFSAIALVFALVLDGSVWAQQAKRPRTGPTSRAALEFKASKSGTILIEVESTRLFAPVIATVRLKNTSSFVLAATDWGVFNDYDVEVLDENGKELERTPYGETLLEPGPLLKTEWIDLKPGEEDVTKIDLTKVYRFTRGGTYSVTVNRQVITQDPKNPPVPGTMERVYSKPQSFVVRP